MRKFGTTFDGNILLEASQAEYSMLCHLASALGGRSLDDIILHKDMGIAMPDFEGVWGAIEAFALAQFRINDMRELIDRMERKIRER